MISHLLLFFILGISLTFSKEIYLRPKRQAFQDDSLTCQNGEGFYPHPNDCRFYYRCWEHQSGDYQRFVFACPYFTVFDVHDNVCKLASLMPDCNSQESRDIFNKVPKYYHNPSTPYSILKTTNNYHKYPYDRNNPKDGKNKNGTHISKKPPSKGTNYEYTTEISINNPYTMSHNNSSKTQNPLKGRQGYGSCQEKADNAESLFCQGEGFFRHPDNCAQFYQCLRNSQNEFDKYLFTCPCGLVFQTTPISYCTYPENVPECNTDTETTEMPDAFPQPKIY